MPYTVSVQIVASHWRVARVPAPVKLRALPFVAEDSRPDIATTATVDVPLLPYVCASGVKGCAGWALVGERLVGFVCKGGLAEMVQHDLRARLDLLLVGLEQLGQAGLDYAREAEQSDRERGQRLLEQMGCELEKVAKPDLEKSGLSQREQRLIAWFDKKDAPVQSIIVRLILRVINHAAITSSGEHYWVEIGPSLLAEIFEVDRKLAARVHLPLLEGLMRELRATRISPETAQGRAALHANGIARPAGRWPGTYWRITVAARTELITLREHATTLRAERPAALAAVAPQS